jgi:hypothetical protein
VSNVRKLLAKLRGDAERLATTLSAMQEQSLDSGRDADMALHMAIVNWEELLEQQYPGLWDAIISHRPRLNVPDKEEADFGMRAAHALLPREFAVISIARLAAACNAALQSLPKVKGGAKKDIYLDELILTLAIPYRNETCKKPTITTSGITNKYGGSFFRFVLACCRAFAPVYAKKSNQALGKAILRALDKSPVVL